MLNKDEKKKKYMYEYIKKSNQRKKQERLEKYGNEVIVPHSWNGRSVWKSGGNKK